MQNDTPSRRRALRRGGDLERAAAHALGGERIIRPWDLFEVRPDVRVPDFPRLVVDTKHRRRWAHNTMLRVIEDKYCSDDQVALLVCKGAGDSPATVTCRLEHYADLLNAIRQLRALVNVLDGPTTRKLRAGGMSIPEIGENGATGNVGGETEGTA